MRLISCCFFVVVLFLISGHGVIGHVQNELEVTGDTVKTIQMLPNPFFDEIVILI